MAAKGVPARRKGELRLLAIAQDPEQPADVRVVALTDYARSRRTLSAAQAALRRQLLATLAHAGQVQAALARLIDVDHARVSRLLSRAEGEGRP